MIQKHIEMTINYLFRKSDSQMSSTWARRFIRHHFIFKQRRQRLIVDARKNVIIIKKLKLYFDQLKEVIEKYNIQVKDT